MDQFITIYLTIGLSAAVAWFCVAPERNLSLFVFCAVAWPILLILWLGSDRE